MITGDQPYSGQPCPQPGCDGVLRVETTRVGAEYRRRYLKCKKCRVAPEKNVESILLRYALRQPARRKNSS